jgi:chromosomal replication initiation ATPase DnaA
MAVCDEYDVSLAAVLGSSRRKTVCEARQMCAYLLRDLMGRSNHDIAECLNGDPSYIPWAYKKTDSRLETSPRTRGSYERVIARLSMPTQKAA